MDWMLQAACRGRFDLNWFPERGEDASPQKSVCSGCTVRQNCLDHAIATKQREGVYGGTTALQRRKIATERRRGQKTLVQQIVEAIQ